MVVNLLRSGHPTGFRPDFKMPYKLQSQRWKKTEPVQSVWTESLLSLLDLRLAGLHGFISTAVLLDNWGKMPEMVTSDQKWPHYQAQCWKSHDLGLSLNTLCPYFRDKCESIGPCAKSWLKPGQVTRITITCLQIDIKMDGMKWKEN